MQRIVGLVGLLGLGCGADGGAVDAGAPEREPEPARCDEGAHVDCFWSTPYCRDGRVYVPIHRPINTCTYAEASALWNARICDRLAGQLACDGAGCGGSINPRFATCVASPFEQGRRADLLCASSQHAEGSPCRVDPDCANSEVRPDAWLRCDRDAGRCAWSPRGGDAGVAPASCVTDDECPIGHVCALDTLCRGVCARVMSDGGVDFDVARSDAASVHDSQRPGAEVQTFEYDAVVLQELDVR